MIINKDQFNVYIYWWAVIFHLRKNALTTKCTKTVKYHAPLKQHFYADLFRAR